MAGGHTTAATARAWLAGMNAHDAPALRALLAEDFAWSDGPSPPFGAIAQRPAGDPGRAASLLIWQDWFAATPDLVFEPVRELDGEDWSIRQLRLRGTQRCVPSALFTPRPASTLAATRSIDLPGCAVLTIRAGRITQLWTYWNEQALRGPTALPHAFADF